MNKLKSLWASVEDAYLRFHVWTVVEMAAMRQRSERNNAAAGRAATGALQARLMMLEAEVNALKERARS